MENISTQFNISATLNNFEGEFAILTLETEEQLKWPKEKFPENVHPGESFKLNILNNEDYLANKEVLAKAVLKEILSNGGEKTEGDKKD